MASRSRPIGKQLSVYRDHRGETSFRSRMRTTVAFSGCRVLFPIHIGMKST